MAYNAFWTFCWVRTTIQKNEAYNLPNDSIYWNMHDRIFKLLWKCFSVIIYISIGYMNNVPVFNINQKSKCCLDNLAYVHKLQ